MAEVGSAYLTVFPKAPGFERALGKETDGAFDGVGRRGGERIGKGVETGGRGSFAAVGKGLGAAFVAGFAAVGIAGIGRAISDFARDALGEATDLNETVSKTGEIFGDDALAGLRRFAKGAASGLGQSEKDALNAASTFGIFGKSAGLAGQDLTGFSTELTTLASDLASFNNTSPEEAVLAIGAALRGEAEPIRSYGVLLDDATLKARAFKEGIIASEKDALTPQQRVLAAYKEILAQTGTQQGDFARTSDGLANSQRIAAAEVENMKAQIGEALMPAAQQLTGFFLEKGVPTLQKLADWFTENEDAVTAFALTTAGMVVGVAEGLLRVGQVVGEINTFWISVFAAMTRAAMDAFKATLDGAEWAFGWVPGVGDKLRTAQGNFATFQRESEAKLDAVEASSRRMAEGFGSAADMVGGLRREISQLQDKDVYIRAHVTQLANGRFRTEQTQYRAAGGPVAAGKPYIVGELEPELFIPDRPGTILNGAQIRAAVGQGGGSGVTQNIYPQAGQDEVTIGRVAADQLTWAARR